MPNTKPISAGSAAASPLPELLTPRLRLRAFRATDRWAVHAYAADPGVCRAMAWEPHTDIAQTETYIRTSLQNPDAGIWALEHRASGQVIGTCGFNRLNQVLGEGELGYVLRPGAWGRGFATEALRTCVGHGEEALGLRHLSAHVWPANQASQRVLAKLGFACTGRLREAMYYRGVFYDLLRFSRQLEA